MIIQYKMPYLNKSKKKVVPSINKQERDKIYQTTKWKDLRIAKLIQQPLCEICLEKEMITPAIDVHHIDSFTKYEGIMKLQKAYDFSNLMSLCKQCHQLIHNKNNKKKLE